MLSILTAMKWPKLFRFDPRWYKWYPELHFFDSDEERTRMLDEYDSGRKRRYLYYWCALLFSVFAGVIVSIFIVIPPFIMLFIPHLIRPYIRPALTGVVTAGVYIIFYHLWRNSRRRLLRKKLVEKGVPICIECGYDLRGQIEPRRPECGTGFDPKLLKNPPSTDNELPG